MENILAYNHKLIEGKKLIVGVSGGVDSVVLTHVLKQQKIEFVIAHCNYNLREDDSKQDEIFVRNLAKSLEIPFHVKSFDTNSIIEKTGRSVQELARELRFNWFEELRLKLDFNNICVATHKDDEIETFFINLLRGSGISGLRGILSKSGKILRPFLPVSRNEIVDFANQNKIEFRHDKSNDSLKYLRNKIRHKLVSVLEEIQHDAKIRISDNIDRLKDVEIIYNNQIELIENEVLNQENELFKIDIAKIAELSPIETYLFEIINRFNFNFSQSKDIVKTLNSESGKMFYSNTHKIVKDRSKLIISKIENTQDIIVEINESDTKILFPIQLTIDIKNGLTKFPKREEIACLNLEKLKFPLQLRKWKNGDKFQPLGMKGKKKVSDFLTDLKMNLFEKENTYVLTSENEIVWVVGKRISEKFKASVSSKSIFYLKLETKNTD